MEKVSVPAGNGYCPQTMFLYGTTKEDGSPNFALFCWISYVSLGDQMGIMACIGEEKLTKDRILETGVFSANLVTEKLLPVADYLGCTSGRNPKKMDIDLAIEQGKKLNVPILSDSPISFELKVQQRIALPNHSDVFLCSIENTLLATSAIGVEDVFEKYELLKEFAPICGTNYCYYSFDGRFLGKWGDYVKQFNK